MSGQAKTYGEDFHTNGAIKAKDQMDVLNKYGKYCVFPSFYIWKENESECTKISTDRVFIQTFNKRNVKTTNYRLIRFNNTRNIYVEVICLNNPSNFDEAHLIPVQLIAYAEKRKLLHMETRRGYNSSY